MSWSVGCTLLAVGWISTPSAFAKTPSNSAEDSKKADVVWGHIEVSGGYTEGPAHPGLFGELTEGLADGIARLDKAAADDSLQGVILRIDNPSIGWAKLNEFQKAIARVRAKGKKVHAWVDGGSSMDYLLATGCDEISMPEPGALMLLGLRAEVSFYKNLFDKLDVKPEMLRVGEFKSAAEPYNRTEMSPEFREEMESILDDYYRQMVTMVAEARKLTPEQVKAAIDAGPLSAKKAKELGLIDRVAYQDELEDALKGEVAGAKSKLVKKYGKKKVDTDFSGFAGMVKMMNLMMGVEEPKRRSNNSKIAVIYATGPIMSGSNSTDMFSGTSTIGSDTMIKAIRQASEDEHVKAVVLRVDSPGGSALASDLMWREFELLKKPFVVSMGDTAASGGYYIAMGADRIFAEPGTLTGSIGVVGGKVALQGLYEKLGITTTILSRGKNSGIMSGTTGFTDTEREAMTRLLHDVYDQFTTKAAAGRKMDKAKLEQLARGRVYTGTQALEKGLVDELGTLDDAIAAAKKLAKLDPDEKLERLILPKPVSPLESLFGPIDPNARLQTANAQLPALLGQFSPELAEQLRALAPLSQLARERVLLVLPFRVTVK
jgi:protease-4